MSAGPSPYAVVLADAFASLPRQVQAFHSGSVARGWVGTSTIRRGRGPLARVAAALFGFPPAGEAVPTTVFIAPHGRGEMWTRDFGGCILRSAQSAGVDRDRHLLFERFGPVCVGSELIPDGDRLRLVNRTLSLLGVPMPTWLLPLGEAFETERDGWFCFDVTIRAPVIGLIVAYRGRLMPAETTDAGL